MNWRKKDGVRRVIRPLLRSTAAWRLSGLTYYSAVAATRGKYVPVRQYVEESRAQMSEVMADIDLTGRRALEFGTGIGGNLIALAGRLSVGIGIDINRGYVRIAKRISKRLGVGNLSFQAYDGGELPNLGQFDLVFSIGVFERLPKSLVRSYLVQLRRALAPGGVIALYFLGEGAKSTEFVTRLGEESYVYWQEEEVRKLTAESFGTKVRIVPFGRGAILAYATMPGVL